MLKRFFLSIFSAALLLQACAQTKKVQAGSNKQTHASTEVNASNEEAIAFPGAEGWGKYTTGGRGGQVLIVTNLNDDGPGSFRKAVLAKGARIVVFAVSGTIHLQSPLSIKSDVTVAGQTAPGDGICLADYPVQLSGDNIIIRYMRFRMGDKNQNQGKVNGAGGDDAFSGTRRNKIIIDHCTMSWSTDEACSVYAGDSTTLQWNIMSEPLNYSYHFETGDTDFEHHGYGGIWGGKHATFHHNLFAHCNSRTPRFDGIRNSPIENADYRNNVIYDWGENNVYAGEGGNYNIVNNYYKYGPSTQAKVKNRVVNPYKKEPNIPFGKFYIAGNYVDGAPDVTANNWLGVTMDHGNATDAANAKLGEAYPSVAIAMQSPQDAYEAVLQHAGASFRRDTLDQRIVGEVRNRTGRMIDVQGGYPHGTDYSISANAWPELKSLPAPKDSDADGMPDEWEVKKGLNANDESDASGHQLHKIYTNVEVYINSLTNQSVQVQQLAFPGAEGFGKYATGGRGGKVVAVTSLNDDGPGSFRQAFYEFPGEPITIVFRVGGIIELKSPIKVNRSNITIAGQTAPGDGICLKGHSFMISGGGKGGPKGNIIVRYLRSRPGSKIASGIYGFDMENCINVIIDHCSFSWANEECAAMYDNKNVTVQWSIVSEGLYNAGHHKGLRSYGGVWGGQNASYHHNLIAHQNSRTVRFNGSRAHDTLAVIDYRNNVVYNWHNVNACYGGEVQINGGVSQINMVNNYYKPGPATPGELKFVRANYDAAKTKGIGQWYMAGNVMDGNERMSKKNILGLDLTALPDAGSKGLAVVVKPFAISAALPQQTALAAYKAVLAGAGAVLPRRDAVDVRLVNETRNRKASGAGTAGNGIIDDASAVGGWPVYTGGEAPADTDGDGMPDEWEKRNGLNPADGADGNVIAGNGYTNLENYLNEEL